MKAACGFDVIVADSCLVLKALRELVCPAGVVYEVDAGEEDRFVVVVWLVVGVVERHEFVIISLVPAVDVRHEAGHMSMSLSL